MHIRVKYQLSYLLLPVDRPHWIRASFDKSERELKQAINISRAAHRGVKIPQIGAVNEGLV